MKLPKLHYFDRSEFIREEDWFTKMSPRLLVLLDTFRHLTGKCIISPHKDAIGRRTEPIEGYYDAHNFNKWGEVRAVDVFPYMRSEILKNNALWWIEKANMLNFGGVGVYPEWKLNGKVRPGLHLDVRDNKATWGRVNGNYVSLDKAMEELA